MSNILYNLLKIIIQIYQEYYNLSGMDPANELKNISSNIIYKKLYEICKNIKCSSEYWKLINLYSQHITNEGEG